MAKVWFVYEGPEPTRGTAAYELPANEAIEKLGVTEDGFISGPEEPPRFGKAGLLGHLAGYKHVVLELEPGDEASSGWALGYYNVPGDPDDVIDVLGPPSDPVSSA